MSLPSRYPECRHILPGGRACQSPAQRGELLCYYHSRKRALVQANRARKHSVALPTLEDRASIQMSLDEVLAALAARKITRREAATYLFAIQIASQNLARIEQLPPLDPVPAESDGDPAACPELVEGSPALADRADQNPTPAADPAGGSSTSPAPSGRAAMNVEDQETEPATQVPGNPPPPSPVPLPGDAPAGLLCDGRDTHEHDPELPLPLTARQLRERRGRIEEDLRNYRATRTHYAAMPETTPGENPAIVLAYVQNAIDKLEAELQALNLQDAPDPP